MRMLKSSRIARSKEQGVKRFIFLLMLSIMSLLAPHSSLLTEVRADEFHYNNILIGDRAAGMAGAYTAVSDDPSGLYYNPAGIVFAPGRSFSASVNAYQYSYKKYKDVLGGNGWERESSNLLPNYFGIIQPLGVGKIGFSYAVPDSRLEDQDQTFYSLASSIPGVNIDRYVINVNDTDYTYNFGPSYAIKINDRLSVGTTIYMHYRERELISNQFITLSNTDYEWTNVYDSLTEWGVKPILGVMWMPADKLSLGLTLSKTYIFDTDRRVQETKRFVGSGNNPPSYGVLESDDDRKFPLEVSLGAAYFPSESLLLSADLRYYGKSDQFSSYPDSTSQRVVNAALGAEYYLNEKTALRGGLFTNMANTPELSSGKVNQPEHIDMYGASLSISRFTRASSLTLGGSYSIDADRFSCKWGNGGPSCDFGSGEAQVFSDRTSIQDTDMRNLTAFISAAFSY